MPLGSVADNLAAASSEPTHIGWVASLDTISLEEGVDIAGIGAVLSFVITAALSVVLLFTSFLGGYRERSISRIAAKLFLDQIAITVLAVTLSFFFYLPFLSAYSRKLVQLCTSLSSISATILFISTRSIDVKQDVIVAITSLASFSITLYNAFDKESVSTELAWLASSTDQVVDSSPVLEISSVITDGLARLLAVFWISGYRRWSGRSDKLAYLTPGYFMWGELALMIVSIPLILLHFAEIIDLYRKYKPYVDNGTVWSPGQVLPLLLNLLPIISIFEGYTNVPQVHVPRVEDHSKIEIGEDISVSQNGVYWYFNISLALVFVRRVKVAVILVGTVGVCLGLMLLLRWYHGKPTTAKQTSLLAGRITYFRNFLHYAFWSNSLNVDYASTSLELIPSRIWFTRARSIPLGYRQISWKCSCGETLAANFDNSNPHALEALERRLHGLSNSGVAEGVKQGPSNSTAWGLSSSSGSTGQGISTSQSSTAQPSTSNGKGSSANITTLSRRNAPSSNNSQRARIPKYFELCVSVGQHSVSLGEINISSTTTDSQLFSKIWESYHEIKGSSPGAAVRGWFFKPDDIFFVYFGVTKRHQVGIYGKPMEIPPPEEVDQGRYHYFRCPMQPLPPMPDHIFLHYLDRARRTTEPEKNPQAHAEDIFLSRLPKKLGSSIFTSETGSEASVSYGWGVHIVERPSALAQSMVGLFSALICIIIFSITWVAVDLSTAIGTGQLVAGVLALANAAIYFALQAYSTRLSRLAP